MTKIDRVEERCHTYGHDFRHLDSKHRGLPQNGGKTHFKRVDQFFCSRCLHIDIVTREETCEEWPDWYMKVPSL